MTTEKDTPNIFKTTLCWKRKRDPVPIVEDILPEVEESKKSADDSSSNGSLPVDRKKTATLTRRKTFHGQIPVDRKNVPTQPPRFSRPRRSISDESTVSSASSLMGQSRNLSQYQQALDKLAHDDRWKKEITLGTRVSFYRLYRDVGKGNFSKVKMAVHYLTKEKVAVKIIDKTKLQPKSKQMLSKEISAMESIQHPHIIRLYEVIETPSKLFLAMEFAEGGELFHKVANGGRIIETEAKILFAQLTSAVEYLHKQNIIHRDLKAENVFISGNNTIKVGDFGFSTRVQNPKEALLTFCGSPPYVAPEIFQNENYIGPSVDIWSLGVLLYFITTASLPFKGDTVSVVKRRILSGVFPVPKFVSKECNDLIRGLLQLDPTKRFTPMQIKNSLWLKGVTFPIPRSGRNAALEKKVVEILENMGITESVLSDHKSKGAKSNVSGTYRILMHKNEDKFFVDEKEKKFKAVILSCPTFQSKTCTIL
ncbi:serine/threonine-protein kinase NIM1-like [Argiope bruennichi]|uniref:serine/threonine-protein kinase NIM1-like n=1 Tax=Argiope bruennichi TaxID=94029 RepID=UPI002493E4D2|nr:serine/threonine-protein kinase NIM1-like [Argiope bruennichi]